MGRARTVQELVVAALSDFAKEIQDRGPHRLENFQLTIKPVSERRVDDQTFFQFEVELRRDGDETRYVRTAIPVQLLKSDLTWPRLLPFPDEKK